MSDAAPEIPDTTGRRFAFVILTVLALIAVLVIIGAIALVRMALTAWG